MHIFQLFVLIFENKLTCITFLRKIHIQEISTACSKYETNVVEFAVYILGRPV
jgi:hypothetical protein